MSFATSGSRSRDDALTGRYELDGCTFSETVDLRGRRDPRRPRRSRPSPNSGTWSPASRTTRPAPRVGSTSPRRPVGPNGRANFWKPRCTTDSASSPYRNDLRLETTWSIEGGADTDAVRALDDPNRVLTPFGGGIDSVVTVAESGRPRRPVAVHRESRQRSLRRPRGDGRVDRPADRSCARRARSTPRCSARRLVLQRARAGHRHGDAARRGRGARVGSRRGRHEQRALVIGAEPTLARP